MIFVIVLALAVLTAAFMSCSDDQVSKQETHWGNDQLKEQTTILRLVDGSMVKQGPYKSWYESGRLHKEGEYKNNKMNGQWTVWYDCDPGVKITQGNFVEGEMDGRWDYWMDPRHTHNRHHEGHTTDSINDSVTQEPTSWRHPLRTNLRNIDWESSTALQ
jgi:antitoxin component YwqK of YwqJK toxin-antitoxin module